MFRIRKLRPGDAPIALYLLGDESAVSESSRLFAVAHPEPRCRTGEHLPVSRRVVAKHRVSQNTVTSIDDRRDMPHFTRRPPEPFCSDDWPPPTFVLIVQKILLSFAVCSQANIIVGRFLAALKMPYGARASLTNRDYVSSGCLPRPAFGLQSSGT